PAFSTVAFASSFSLFVSDPARQIMADMAKTIKTTEIALRLKIFFIRWFFDGFAKYFVRLYFRADGSSKKSVVIPPEHKKNERMVGDIIFIFIEFLIHSTIPLGLLWIMIKIQKFDYNFPALLGSAFLAGGLDLIPHFGHMIAVPVLYFC